MRNNRFAICSLAHDCHLFPTEPLDSVMILTVGYLYGCGVRSMGKVNDCTWTKGQLVAPEQAPEPEDVLALALLCDLQRARGGDRVIM